MTTQKKGKLESEFLSWGLSLIEYLLHFVILYVLYSHMQICWHALILQTNYLLPEELNYNKRVCVCVCVCVSTNYMVIVAICDIPTVVVLLQIQVFLVVLTGEYLPAFRTVIWSEQRTARPPKMTEQCHNWADLLNKWNQLDVTLWKFFIAQHV